MRVEKADRGDAAGWGYAVVLHPREPAHPLVLDKASWAPVGTRGNVSNESLVKAPIRPARSRGPGET